MRKLTIVNIIPTYNECANISNCLASLLKTGNTGKYRYLILVVDDNSPDGTAKVVINLQKKHKNIYLLSGKKQGLGIAMIRGLKYAVNKLHADIVIPNEADLAYPAAKIPYMLKKIEDGYDVVVASRHVPGANTRGWTPQRKLNHWVANTLFATWVAGTHEVKDKNGAFRAIRVKGVLDQINLDELPSKGFGFFNYLIYKLTMVTDKFHEFPITYRFRTRGESKVSFNPKYFRTFIRDMAEYITLCLRIRYERITSRQ